VSLDKNIASRPRIECLECIVINVVKKLISNH